MANIYVDYSASNDGDGTTAAQAGSPASAGAFNTLVGKTFAAGDYVWIRRTTTSNQGSSLTLSTDKINYIGWPKSGDDLYATRPATGTSNGWDADGNDEFNWKANSSGVALTLSANSCRFHRFKVENVGTITFLTVTGHGNLFTRCVWLASSGVSANITTVTGHANRFFNHTISASAGLTTSTSILIHISGDGSQFLALTLTSVGYSGGSSLAGALRVSGNYTIFKDLVITFTGTITTVSAYVFNVGGVMNMFDTVTVTMPSNTSAACPLLSITGSNNTFRNITWDYCGTGSSTIDHIAIAGNSNRLWITGPVERANTNIRYLLNITADGNIVYLKNVTANNTGAGSSEINFAAGAQYNIVYCDNCLFCTPLTQWFLNSPVNARNAVYSINHNQVSGLFKSARVNGIVESSNTVRSGGDTYSLRMEVLKSSPNHFDPLAFGDLFEQTIWLSLTSGSRTITLYGAHKLFGTNVPTKADIWFEVEDKANDNMNTVISSQDRDNAALESDASTWSNDPGVTAFKISKTFTVTTTAVVPFRIYYYKYVPNAYIYIDPTPVVS